MKSPVIISERLFLRRFVPSDYFDLYEYLSDPEVVRYEPYSVFSLRQAKTEALNRANSCYYWAVCLKDSEKLIGNLYFNPTEYDTYELGFVFNRFYQKRGYAKESCCCLMEYAFHTMHVRRIIAFCCTENVNSWRLMERLSMRRESCMLQNISFTKDAYGNPIYCDSYGYAILKSEFELNQLRSR